MNIENIKQTLEAYNGYLEIFNTRANNFNNDLKINSKCETLYFPNKYRKKILKLKNILSITKADFIVDINDKNIVYGSYVEGEGRVDLKIPILFMEDYSKYREQNLNYLNQKIKEVEQDFRNKNLQEAEIKKSNDYKLYLKLKEKFGEN